MKKSTVWIGLVFLIFTSGVQAAEGSGREKAKPLPADYTLLDQSIFDDLNDAYKVALAWPSEARIVESNVHVESEAFQRAVDSTMEWLKNSLNEDYLPGNLDGVRFIPLKRGYSTHDALRLRYQVDEHVVQILATSHIVVIVIKEEAKQGIGVPIEIDKANSYVSECIDKFLKGAGPIKELASENIHKTRNGVQGEFGCPDYLCRWSETRWWTDGNTVLFQVSKYAGQGYWPEPPKDWF